MIRPATLNSRPSYLPLVPLAALIATLLSASILNVAPAVGLPRADVPGLLGGVFTSDPGWALGLGYVLYFFIGVLIAPLPLVMWWPRLPGDAATVRGAAVRGLMWGVIYGLVNGVFAVWFGVVGALVLLIASVAWAMSFALVAVVGRGIAPLDTLGWAGYAMASSQDDTGRSLGTHASGR